MQTQSRDQSIEWTARQVATHIKITPWNRETNHNTNKAEQNAKTKNPSPLFNNNNNNKGS